MRNPTGSCSIACVLMVERRVSGVGELWSFRAVDQLIISSQSVRVVSTAMSDMGS